MLVKFTEEELEKYINRVEDLSKSGDNNLKNFLNSYIKDTELKHCFIDVNAFQYIKVKSMLKTFTIENCLYKSFISKENNNYGGIFAYLENEKNNLIIDDLMLITGLSLNNSLMLQKDLIEYSNLMLKDHIEINFTVKETNIRMKKFFKVWLARKFGLKNVEFKSGDYGLISLNIKQKDYKE